MHEKENMMSPTERNRAAFQNSEKAREQRNTPRSSEHPQIASENFRNWKIRLLDRQKRLSRILDELEATQDGKPDHLQPGEAIVALFDECLERLYQVEYELELLTAPDQMEAQL